MFDKEADELAHLYVDGAISRREMVRRARNIVGGVAGVSAALNMMGTPLRAQMCGEDLRVPADAPDLEADNVVFPGEASVLMAYLVRPKREETNPIPGVLVIHENRGLNDHIRDVTRRVARAGFVALGIDLLSRQGGTGQFATPTEQQQAYGRTTVEGRLADMRSAVAYLRAVDGVRGDRIGSVGFCAGGANVWLLGTSDEEMTASVVYYGTPVALDRIANLKGALLCHYAELDRNLTINSAPVIPALINQRKTFGYMVHEGVGHAFNNDTGAAFNRGAACEAWAKTIDFFSRHLNRAEQ
jgi:carboxymethylenebutenolidase